MPVIAPWLLAALILAPGPCAATDAAAAGNCDEIKAGIEARVRAGGVQSFRIEVVEASASAAGRVVGRCARGSRKLVYLPVAVAASPAAPASKPPLLTECLDGRVVVGGSCRR